jgi:hypothetical protein
MMCNGHVCFTPGSDIKCDIWNVRFGPKADIGPISDERSNARQDNPDLGELAYRRLAAEINADSICACPDGNNRSWHVL